MGYGYHCNWCGSFAKPRSTGDVRETTIPNGWAQISHDEHVCKRCLDRGRNRNKPKPKCKHANRQLQGPTRPGDGPVYKCLDCGDWLEK